MLPLRDGQVSRFILDGHIPAGNDYEKFMPLIHRDRRWAACMTSAIFTFFAGISVLPDALKAMVSNVYQAGESITSRMSKTLPCCHGARFIRRMRLIIPTHSIGGCLRGPQEGRQTCTYLVVYKSSPIPAELGSRGRYNVIVLLVLPVCLRAPNIAEEEVKLELSRNVNSIYYIHRAVITSITSFQDINLQNVPLPPLPDFRCDGCT